MGSPSLLIIPTDGYNNLGNSLKHQNPKGCWAAVAQETKICQFL